MKINDWNMLGIVKIKTTPKAAIEGCETRKAVSG